MNNNETGRLSWMDYIIKNWCDPPAACTKCTGTCTCTVDIQKNTCDYNCRPGNGYHYTATPEDIILVL